MPNENSQAATTELVTPQAAQVPEQTPKTSAQTEPQTEEPINREVVEQIAREVATRIAQSQVAKGENRINEVIQNKFKALEESKGALNLSDDQVAQARQKIVVDAYSAVEETTTNVPAQPSPDVDQAIQYVNAEIGNVFAEIGISVTKADPEFAALQKAVNDSWNDQRGLVKILRAAEKAATAKAERTAKQQEHAQSRVVSGGGEATTGGVSDGATGRDLLSQAYKG